MRSLVSPATLLLAAALGCANQEPAVPTEPPRAADGPAAAAATRAASAEQPKLERLARRVALALRDAGFRARLKRELDRSRIREHKVHLQRLLAAGGGRFGIELARLNGEPAAALQSEAQLTQPLEMYFPVPAHRTAWRGGPDLLVATAEHDGDAPVAFDLTGRRLVLDAATPPDTPVLAIEPVETDFDRVDLAPFTVCLEDCQGPGAGLGPVPGLYLTASHLNQTFEGWLKGSPEIEMLVLGQKGGTDSLTKYQCVGERAATPYNFDQNDNDWSGNVLLFSQSQLDAYKAQHPGQAVRLFFMEDDDTSCELKNNAIDRLLGQVDAATRGLSGGKDSTSTLGKLWKYLTALQKVFAAAGGLIRTSDDLIGNAVEDVVAGESHPGYNWVLRGENNQTNGYVKFQMR